MKPLKRHFTTIGLGLILSCLTGCASLTVREAKLGTVTAHAQVEKKIPSYFEIEIEKPLDDSAPRLWIKMPNGKIIDRAWFNYANLKLAGFQSFPEKDYQPGARFTQELTRYGASFFFDLGSLKMIRFTQTTGDSVSLAREKGKDFYKLPLTQEQLEQLFGKPDAVSDKMAF
jgi:hypothetical protein